MELVLLITVLMGGAVFALTGDGDDSGPSESEMDAPPVEIGTEGDGVIIADVSRILRGGEGDDRRGGSPGNDTTFGQIGNDLIGGAAGETLELKARLPQTVIDLGR